MDDDALPEPVPDDAAASSGGRRPARVVGALAAAVLLLVGLGRWWAGSAPVPADVGVGVLAPCVTTTNCVTSVGPAATVDPLRCDASQAEVRDAVLAAILAMPRTTIVRDDGLGDDGAGYVHATQNSRVLGFIDDLEVTFDAGRIDVRSASRLGQGDMGVNADRVATWRANVEAILGVC